MYNPDRICIVESWLSGDIHDSEHCIDGYDIVRLNHNRYGGGVLLFINSVFTHHVVFTGRPELELIIVSIHLLSVSLTIALFYRPGSQSVILDNLLTALCTHINPPLLTDLIILGDFNVNYFDTSHPLFSKLLSVSNSLTLTQVVSIPTHYSSNSNSLIDLVFLSSPKDLLFCDTLPPLSNSDYLGLSLVVSIAKPKRNPTICFSTLTSMSVYHSFLPLNDPAPVDPEDCPASILHTEEQVMELLCSLDTTKSTGLDGVSALMLKQTAFSIAPSLTKLFNLSITSGLFPSDWKCARITLIFKSSDPSLPKTYHPISILSIASKLLE